MVILYGEETAYSYPDLTLDIGRTRSRTEVLSYGTLLALMYWSFTAIVEGTESTIENKMLF